VTGFFIFYSVELSSIDVSQVYYLYTHLLHI
jgi:hypothetical protein